MGIINRCRIKRLLLLNGILSNRLVAWIGIILRMEFVFRFLAMILLCEALRITCIVLFRKDCNLFIADILGMDQMGQEYKIGWSMKIYIRSSFLILTFLLWRIIFSVLRSLWKFLVWLLRVNLLWKWTPKYFTVLE